MAAGTEVNTVWIGFMDIVPVIGTVKEAVELVLALYEGNKAVVKEKEKAVEEFVKKPFKKYGKTFSGKPAAYASEFSGLKNVEEVTMEKIMEYMVKGSKKETKPSPAQQKERRRRLVEIREDMVEKIRKIDPDFRFNQELKEELGRSRRGEHVFNNNILKFHSKVLNDFIQHNHINNLQGYNQQEMDELGSHTLQKKTEREIQYNMVVDFADDEFYVNVNAVMYGAYCQALREALLAVLNHMVNSEEVREEERNRVNYVIDEMNNLEIYVDQLAKVTWINNRQDRQTQFTAVKGEVVNMYRTGRGLNWCNDIWGKVAPLLGF